VSASLSQLIAALHSSRGVAHKRDISAVVAALGIGGDSCIRVGDDCAAIPDPSGDGWLLLAIEGFLTEFVEREPRFAGWCGVMVNVSDIYAMGGRPIAVVDAIWSRDATHGKAILDGMAEAARVYGVPVVGGHANARAGNEQLSVAILGRAKALLSSFEAKPGDVLIAAPTCAVAIARISRTGTPPVAAIRNACAAISTSCRHSRKKSCAVPPRTSATPACSAPC